MPLEEKRTRSLHYYVFNSLAFLYVGRLARHVNTDIRDYEGRRGQSLRKSLSFLAPYAQPDRPWPHQQIGSSSRPDLGFLLLLAAQDYEDPVLLDAARRAFPLIADRAEILAYDPPAAITDW